MPSIGEHERVSTTDKSNQPYASLEDDNGSRNVIGYQSVDDEVANSANTSHDDNDSVNDDSSDHQLVAIRPPQEDEHAIPYGERVVRDLFTRERFARSQGLLERGKNKYKWVKENHVAEAFGYGMIVMSRGTVRVFCFGGHVARGRYRVLRDAHQRRRARLLQLRRDKEAKVQQRIERLRSTYCADTNRLMLMCLCTSCDHERTGLPAELLNVVNLPLDFVLYKPLPLPSASELLWRQPPMLKENVPPEEHDVGDDTSACTLDLTDCNYYNRPNGPHSQPSTLVQSEAVVLYNTPQPDAWTPFPQGQPHLLVHSEPPPRGHRPAAVAARRPGFSVFAHTTRGLSGNRIAAEPTQSSPLNSAHVHPDVADPPFLVASITSPDVFGTLPTPIPNPPEPRSISIEAYSVEFGDFVIEFSHETSATEEIRDLIAETYRIVSAMGKGEIFWSQVDKIEQRMRAINDRHQRLGPAVLPKATIYTNNGRSTAPSQGQQGPNTQPHGQPAPSTPMMKGKRLLQDPQDSPQNGTNAFGRPTKKLKPPSRLLDRIVAHITSWND